MVDSDRWWGTEDPTMLTFCFHCCVVRRDYSAQMSTKESIWHHEEEPVDEQDGVVEKLKRHLLRTPDHEGGALESVAVLIR